MSFTLLCCVSQIGGEDNEVMGSLMHGDDEVSSLGSLVFHWRWINGQDVVLVCFFHLA